MEVVSITISIIALAISLITFWFTRVHRGTVKMTKPTVIFFGPDGDSGRHEKIFIRTLLYSTSDKGQYIENMYIRLQRGETVRNFNIWVYGDEKQGLSRGSGLFVSKSGLAANHHFLLPKDGSSFEFKTGEYQLDIFVEPVKSKPKKIYSQNLTITGPQGKALTEKEAGIYFDWAPNTQTYQSHIDTRLEKISNLVEILNHLDN